MTPPGATNLVAAGRCVDGDAAALSSVRVMGPCSAMGAAAAHALDLAGRSGADGGVHDIDIARFLLEGLARGNLAYDRDARVRNLITVVDRAVRMLNRKGDVHDLWD